MICYSHRQSHAELLRTCVCIRVLCGTIETVISVVLYEYLHRTLLYFVQALVLSRLGYPDGCDPNSPSFFFFVSFFSFFFFFFFLCFLPLGDNSETSH